LFLKIEINQSGETPYYIEKLILPLDSQTQCFLLDVQLLWSYDYSKWAIVTMEHFKFRYFDVQIGITE